jgi:hypothetical protein
MTTVERFSEANEGVLQTMSVEPIPNLRRNIREVKSFVHGLLQTRTSEGVHRKKEDMLLGMLWHQQLVPLDIEK